MTAEKDKLKAHSNGKHAVPIVLEGKVQTFIKGLALGGHGALPAAIDTKNGRIVRIRPLHLDWIPSIPFLP